MVFVELPIFMKTIREICDDDELRALQNVLLKNPEMGDIIPGSGGVRKMRWAAKGHGKRGGSRVIYFYANQQQQIFFLFAYPKNVKTDLSAQEVKVLKSLVKELIA
jgi:hypothetical protein